LDAALLAALAFFAPFPLPWGKSLPSLAGNIMARPPPGSLYAATRGLCPVCRFIQIFKVHPKGKVSPS
jgi:hypothetical protein